MICALTGLYIASHTTETIHVTVLIAVRGKYEMKR